MEDTNPIHKSYRNTIELPEGNNMAPLRSDTIRLVQNGCSFHGFWSEDPNQHLKDFLKLVDSLDLDGANREITRLTTKLRNDILMFQQHQRESLSETWTRFQDLLQKVPHHDIDFWLQVQIFYDHVTPATRRTIDQSSGVSKITSSCEIFSGPHDTQYCIEDPEQAFIEYASSRIDEAGGLMSNFMSSQDARLSKFEADFKQQQSEMTNKIDTVLKAITNRMAGALPSDTVKNPKLNVNSTSLVLSARFCHIEDPQCSTQIHCSINTITIHQSNPRNDKPREEEQEEKDDSENINTNPSSPLDPSVSFITEKVRKLNSFFESLGLVPQSSDTEFVCIKRDDGDVIFIEIIKQDDDSHIEEPEVGENAGVEGS
ncbi:hypothetical protein Tco_0839387 [Tanacetum coccineum]|uniref:MAK10-like protein n=1 Tax=Tanacetum coccineum TaxID=301880 RepID=A0ABQ5AQG6_9ASTR